MYYFDACFTLSHLTQQNTCSVVRLPKLVFKSNFKEIYMEKFDFMMLLKTAFAENNILHLLNDHVAEGLFSFASFLQCENKKYNLTALRDPIGIVYKHFVDSLLISEYIPPDSRVIDIGCGAGFPSIPLALARPDLNITSLDSASKKITFINMSISGLGISNLSALCARAEETAHYAVYRERFDCAVARAVSAIPVISELAIPFLRVKGSFLIMKGRDGIGEFNASNSFLGKLHSECHQIVSYSLSIQGLDELRTLIRLEKLGKTPDNFPRHYSQITKKPL